MNQFDTEISCTLKAFEWTRITMALELMSDDLNSQANDARRKLTDEARAKLIDQARAVRETIKAVRTAISG